MFKKNRQIKNKETKKDNIKQYQIGKKRRVRIIKKGQLSWVE